MPASVLTSKQNPAARSVFAAFGDWMRKRKLARQNLRGLDDSDNYEVMRVARDIGLSPIELRRMIRLGPDAAKQLPTRMTTLHLDADALAKSKPGVMRDMQRLCATCASKKRCQRDLTRDPENRVWRQYCPNAGTLVELQIG